MKNKTFIFILAIGLFLLTSCSSASSEVISLNEIPAPPSLTIYEGAEEYALDTEVFTSEQASAKSISTQYYWMAEAGEWESVQAHYRDTFNTRGWELVHEDANTLRWDSGKQAFEVSMVPSSEGEGYIVVLILVSKE